MWLGRGVSIYIAPSLILLRFSNNILISYD
nr:MAG TPA: Protein of unknown function (DUF3775) [Caudoviricetes sp.]